MKSITDSPELNEATVLAPDEAVVLVPVVSFPFKRASITDEADSWEEP
jgi:hypothetical protein